MTIWRIVRLKEAGDIVSGVTLGRSLPAGQTRRVPYLRVATVKDGYLALDDVRHIDVTDAEFARWRLRRGDLLLTEGGDPDKLGRGSVWGEQLSDCIYQNHIFRIRLDPALVVPEFASAEIASPYGKPYFLRHANRTTGIATIKQKVLAAFPLKIPPIVEQRRILVILDDQLAAVERARTAAEARLGAASAIVDASMQVAFGGSAPQHWPRQQLADCADIVGGVQKTPDRAPDKNTVPYLTVRNVQRGALDLPHIEKFEVTPIELSRLRLADGDLLIVEGNGSADQIGRNALFTTQDEPWIHQNHIIRVRLRREIALPPFVSACLNSEGGRRQMLQKARTTSGLYTLRVGKVGELEIPLPSIEEQRTLAESLLMRKMIGNQARRAAEDELAAIRMLPGALLRQAFGGEP